MDKEFGLNGGTEGLPVQAFYDKENECWYFCGMLPEGFVGGVPEVLINKSGQVLALWHSM